MRNNVVKTNEKENIANIERQKNTVLIIIRLVLYDTNYCDLVKADNLRYTSVQSVHPISQSSFKLLVILCLVVTNWL